MQYNYALFPYNKVEISSGKGRTAMEDAAKKLTNAEKAAIVQGTDFMYTRGAERLGVPRLSMADGPHGLRKQIGSGDNGVSKSEPATAFPTAACVAASWDPENARRIGKAIGEECRAYGVHMLLGPGVNIKRDPLCGRNFEYYSEDPLLSGRFGAAFVRGVQENGVSACVKHFALNNQENFRFVGNSVVDERAMREIYLKPFEIAVKEGGPGAVMSSYNRINGVFASENRWLLDDILRREWGFDGLVMSDWGGTHDRVAGLRAGEDLEMPGDTAVNLKRVYDALEDGSLAKEEADACVGRVLDASERFARAPKRSGFDREEHARLAARAAADSAVLLKNDGDALPLDPSGSFCVIGELFERMRYQGAGSSMITPTEVITHKDAFDARKIKYEYARGYSVGEDDGVGGADEAVQLAAKYDTVLLYLGLTDFAESEGGDRVHMRLPENQLKLVEALAPLNKRLIVVLSGGSPVELPFAGDAAAILYLCLPGQCGGEAGARLLFGEENPSGKLAETWYPSYACVPYGEEYSKGENELYKESVFVGYRWALSAGVKPQFPFGFGLSYTEFSYDGLRVLREDGRITALVRIRNAGERAGAEAVQLYVRRNGDSAVFRPLRELRAFCKVRLEPGESREVRLGFEERELAFWNVREHGWTLENGVYTLEVCASSEDVRLSEELEILSGESVPSPYTERVNGAMSGGKSIGKEVFRELLGEPLPQEAPALPLTMESRFCDFRQTFFGRLLYGAVCGVAGRQLARARKLPAGAERDNRVKGALFLQRIFDTNCLRTLSLSSGRSLPWNVAEGMTEIANGHLLRGIAKMCRTYKIKGAK